MKLKNAMIPVLLHWKSDHRANVGARESFARENTEPSRDGFIKENNLVQRTRIQGKTDREIFHVFLQGIFCIH